MAMYLGNPRRGVALRRRISLIDGRDWSVVVGGMTLGSFTTAGSDVLLEGTIACGRPPSGTVSAAATDLPPTSLPPTDAGPANERRTPAIALFALLAVFASALAASFVGMRRRRRQAAQS
jgi:hypothetical protein